MIILLEEEGWRVGLEVVCKAEIDGQAAEGKLQLEGTEIRFHGLPKLRIAVPDLTAIEVRRGQLQLTWSGRTAVFHLGSDAEKWLLKIRYPKGRLDKLGVKEGLPETFRIGVVGVADEEFVAELEARAPKVFRRSIRDADILFVGITKAADLERIGGLRDMLKPDGAMWTVYPKGQKQLTQAMVMEAARSAGLVDTKVAAFSDTCSALKWVIPLAKRGVKE
ncbi:MAG: hypothetical protein JNL98_34930 [Bryobacterales bacterium]|nr:hypothetical protein [Bryobacterales bacterium]